MFNIKRLRAEIISDKSGEIIDVYGFDFTFERGLNIVAGPNSRGKTTVNSCIYYVLGMEELLGARNEKALDKALKEEFTIEDNEDSEKGIVHKVLSSRVLCELTNDRDEIVCLERYVKSLTDDVKTSNIKVYHCSMHNLQSNEVDKPIGQQVFFVNARGNNDDPNGFYNWLSSFIGIDLPTVSNTSRVDNYSPLYLQTIFSASLIEQTKGWSDFFATMPFFGVTRAKEKIVEFLLGLNELKLSTQKDVFQKEKNQILDEWKRKVKSFSFLEKQMSCSIINVPEELTTDKTDIDRIGVLFTISEDEKVTLQEYMTQKQDLVTNLENRPISTVEQNREETLTEFNRQKNEYADLSAYIERFENKFRIERLQLNNLSNQLSIVETEIKEHLNLKKVFTENIINESNSNHCPTCSQIVSTNLISSRNIQIPQLTLDENTNFLRSQKKVIDASTKSLTETLGEKEVLLNYFKNSLRQKELVIKKISKDLISDDRAFSEAEVIQKIQLEGEIERLKNLNRDIKEIQKELEALAIGFYNNAIKISNLGASEKEDEIILSSFETLYKDLLFDFGYESNAKHQISINRKEPFKYFPVYMSYKNDATPQSIRINSSASDFVRNLWAYTLSLLIKGKNHSGIVMFDEPGQHRTNLDSIKSLLTATSKINKGQVIVFTSTDREISNGVKIDLDYVTSEVNISNMNLIRLSENNKVIQSLKPAEV